MTPSFRRSLGCALACIAPMFVYTAELCAATMLKGRSSESERAPYIAHPALQAQVEALNTDFVAGWACAPGQIEAPVYLDASPLGMARLVRAAPSVSSRCPHGAASYAFQSVFPAQAQDDLEHRVVVYARGPK